MGYIIDPRMVRVDFFKPSGKWYTTEAIKWDRYRSNITTNNPNNIGETSYEHPEDTFKRCLIEQLGLRLSDLVAVCLEPYHEHGYPLMIKDWTK